MHGIIEIVDDTKQTANGQTQTTTQPLEHKSAFHEDQYGNINGISIIDWLEIIQDRKLPFTIWKLFARAHLARNKAWLQRIVDWCRFFDIPDKEIERASYEMLLAAHDIRRRNEQK